MYSTKGKHTTNKGGNKMKAITTREAHKIEKKLNRDLSGDGITFYATNEKETEIYCFDSRKERNSFVKAYNDKFGI